MGNLLGHAVRFGIAHDVLAVGEGIETMLSLRLAAGHGDGCRAVGQPPCRASARRTLRRLYIANDADAAGDRALAALTERAAEAGVKRGLRRRGDCGPRCALNSRRRMPHDLWVGERPR